MGRLSDWADGSGRFRIHTRSITTSTYPYDASHVLSVGRLTDTRHAPSYGFTGRHHPAGPLHELEIILLLHTPDLTIEEAEVRIRTVPRPDCESLDRSLDGAVGLTIGPGFTEKAKGLAGRGTGCTHLAHLLTVMAPAILQGWWALSDRELPEPGEARRRAGSATRFLRDTCYTWRAGGDALRELAEIAGMDEASAGVP